MRIPDPLASRRCLLVFSAFFLFPAAARAHTLPISFLTLVPDADYLHVELRMNPFELNFFSELDRNGNRHLDPAELGEAGQSAASRILDQLTFDVDGNRMKAEVFGLMPEADGHHMTLRAHYRIDAREGELRVASKLMRITSGSHVVQVTLVRPNNRLNARLDAHSAAVTFGAVRVSDSTGDADPASSLPPHQNRTTP